MSAEIKFARDYGMPPASPFFIVSAAGAQFGPDLETREEAEAFAARLATENPGRDFHILGVVATISTSAEVIGKRFDPQRVKLIERAAEPQPLAMAGDPPEFAEVDEAPSPTWPAGVALAADDEPL